MSRKNFLIIIIIVLIVILLVIFNQVKNDHKQINQRVQQAIASPTLPPSVPQTVLQLFPNPALPDSEGDIDLDVSMNTHNNRVYATQFTIQYDPTALQFLSIKPDDAFYNAKVLVQNVNETTGILTYSLKLPPPLIRQPARGDYGIAELNFKAKRHGVTTVKILFASITSPDNKHSVLKSMESTTVKMNQ
jgi:hypothetical protein